MKGRHVARWDSEARKYRLLARSGFLSEEELAEASEEAWRRCCSLPAVLAERHRISRSSLGWALSAHFRRPFVEFDPALKPARDVAAAVGSAHLRAHRWVPLRREGRTVHVLTDDPGSPGKTAEIRRVLRGLEPRFYVGLPEDVLAYIAALERGGRLPTWGAAPPTAPAARRDLRGLLAALALMFWPMPLQREGLRRFGSALGEGSAPLPEAPTVEVILKEGRAAGASRKAAARRPVPQEPRGAELRPLTGAQETVGVASPAAPPPPASAPAPSMPKGEMANAQAISAAARVPLEDVLAARESGLGWGVIARNFGITMGAARQYVRTMGGPGGAPPPAPPGQTRTPPGQTRTPPGQSKRK